MSVVLQIYLVSGWGLQKRRSAQPYELQLGEEPLPLPSHPQNVSMEIYALQPNFQVAKTVPDQTTEGNTFYKSVSMSMSSEDLCSAYPQKCL